MHHNHTSNTDDQPWFDEVEGHLTAIQCAKHELYVHIRQFYWGVHPTADAKLLETRLDAIYQSHNALRELLMGEDS